MAERITRTANGLPRRGPSRRRARRILGALLAVLFLLFIALLVWLQEGNLLGKPAAALASRLTGRTIAADEISLRLFSLHPSLTARGLTVSEAASPDTLAEIELLRVRANPLGLITSAPLLTQVEVRNPSITLIRTASGATNWAGEEGGGNGQWNVPAIGALTLANGHVSYADARHKLTFNATFNAHDVVTASSGIFTLEGQGRLNNAPFELSIRGNPLASVRNGKPYPFHFRMQGVNTTLVAQGQVTRPFNLATAQGSLRVRGQNLADLYYLTGLAFPNSKPYQLSANLRQQGRSIHINSLQGRVGGSDLSGHLTVTLKEPRPLLSGELSSRKLDVADAGILFGPPPNAQKLFPTTPFAVERLRAMDAHILYRAQSLNVTALPLREVSLTLNLEDAVLKFEPLDVRLPQGRVRGDFTLNAAQTPPTLAVDARLNDARLENFFPSATTPPLEGRLVARARLTGQGASVHQAMASAQGTFTVVIPKGEVRQAFAELMGIDVAESLGLILSGNHTQTGIRCGVASFDANKGILTAKSIVFDTDVVIASGTGTVNLGQETLDLELQGHPKEPRLIRLRAPVTIGGTLRNPKPGVHLAQASTQAGVAVAVGALLTPIASLLPFVDAGLADDANCRALIGEARRHGAQVTPAATTP